MKFYDREKEIAQLRQWEELSLEYAQMTVVVGRRRIGKTTLIKKAMEGRMTLYFFVAKKNETLLCEEFVELIRVVLNVKIVGQLTDFKSVFEYLMQLSTERHFTLIIDEFQEFFNINSSVYSDMQNIWDEYKEKSKLNLIVCGSVYSLMKRIFENAREPLFQRANHRIVLRPFNVEIIKNILSDHYKEYSNDDLLAFYMITGGVARYIELMIEARAFTKEALLDMVFSENSYFLDEGRNVLIEEFGKDYTTYFSILSLLASSKTSRPEIEGELGMSVGPQIKNLETDFNLIKRVIPIFAKPQTRQIKYYIDDNFLNFWFRFIYKYRSVIEIGNFDYLKDIIRRDYTVYVGRVLERYFREKLILSKRYSAIGSYWENGNQNEIDIVALNEMEKQMFIGEVKYNRKSLNMRVLEEKAINIKASHPKYHIEFVGLSLEDM